jgi:PucR C-terminal helix-turn-helix domain/GGDEF-like domain
VPPVLDLRERLALRRARSRAPVQDLASELVADLERVAAAITRRVLSAEQRLVDADDPTLATLAGRFVHSTVGAVLSALAYGLPADGAHPTEASIALLGRLAERDDGLVVALRAQRLLHDELWQTWAAFSDQRVDDRVMHSSLLAASTRQLAAYTDCVCERLTEAWPETSRRRRRGLDVSVEELLGRAVFGGPEPASHALATLGYPADGLHLGIAVPPSRERDGLDGLARRLKLACGTPTLTDGSTVWVSLTCATPAERVEGARPLLELAGPVGIGDPGAGLEGFRRTRQQAVDALRVATLGDDSGITRHRDIALLAVLCADEGRARELAWVELGPLAADNEVAIRLRETIGAYLEAGESQVATAQRLFIHEKTVKYRLRQAEELLGRKIPERRAELGVALMIHRAFDK